MYAVAVPGAPFSAIPTADEQAVFVSINATDPRQQNGIAVLSCVAGRYRLQRVIPLESEATVMAMTEDIPGDDGGAVYAAVSPDDRYAVVAEEQSAKLSVIDLRAARTSHYAHSSIVSEFLIGNAPVASVFPHDGKYLFVTVQSALKHFNYAHTCEPEGGRSGDPNEAPGAVMVVDVAKMASDPDHAIVGQIQVGKFPRQFTETRSGSTIFLANYGSNSLTVIDPAAIPSLAR